MQPGDLRMLISSGPFALASGDSQDVIFASLIEQGTDRLNSITKLRKSSSDLRYIFDRGLGNVLSNSALSAKFISPDSTVISIKSNSPEAQTISAKLYRENYEFGFGLMDDSMHNDGGSNDGVFGNAVTIPPNPELTKLSLTVSYKDGQTITFDEAGSITTSGPVKVENFKIISDNINADVEANPGENIRCLFGLKNFYSRYTRKFYYKHLSDF